MNPHIADSTDFGGSFNGKNRKSDTYADNETERHADCDY